MFNPLILSIMLINPRIRKQVNESVAECRKCIVNATIELLKQLGAESDSEVVFRHVLFLHQFKYRTSETRPADRICFSERKNCDSYYLTYFGDDYPASSHFLTIDNLLLIYEEVKRLVRAE